jgi:DNA-directed RNA polymerase beta subunit
MKNIHDFQKAIEQKQQRLKMKDKHVPSSMLFEKEIMNLLKATETNQEIAEECQKISDVILDQHKELANKYSDVVDKYGKLAELTSGVVDQYDHLSYLRILTEHFIVENDLEDKFIDFLKDVAENEKVDDYREAAKRQVDSYHYEYDGEEYYTLDYEYEPSWMQGDETEESN